MKFYSLLVITSLVVLISCSGEKSQVPANVVNIPNSATGNGDMDQLPAIEFNQTEHDFGKVIQGEILAQ